MNDTKLTLARNSQNNLTASMSIAGEQIFATTWGYIIACALQSTGTTRFTLERGVDTREVDLSTGATCGDLGALIDESIADDELNFWTMIYIALSTWESADPALDVWYCQVLKYLPDAVIRNGRPCLSMALDSSEPTESIERIASVLSQPIPVAA